MSALFKTFDVFGKRTSGELTYRESPPENSLAVTRNKIILDYIISHVDHDKRPYLQVSILGRPIVGLLDSGATQTVIGNSGYYILSQLGLKITTRETKCTVADGGVCISPGYIKTPITLQGKTIWLDILIVPSLKHCLILGIDFWAKMEIVPNMRDDVWHFADDSSLATLENPSDPASFLSEAQQKQLQQLLEDKFSLMGNELGCTSVGEHEIELLPNTTPIKQRWYPVSPPKQKIIDEELNYMLENEIIEPSNSAWSSPVCLVPKKDGTYRFCVDYRQLNSVTKKDAYPLPNVSNILDNLRDAKFLSSLDIKAAFHQVMVKESSREYTAFTVPGRGLYQFRRLPFGLSNSPATFQRIIDKILGPDLLPYVFVYLDDIIVISGDFDTHLKILRLVLDRLLQAGLVVKKEKCFFCRPQLKYLGFVVDRYGLHPDPDKVNSILHIPVPQNVREMRRFIGTASWYRRFVPNFSSIVAPLTRLTKRNVKWLWSEECDAAFQLLKEKLSTPPILTCPDFDRQFIVQTDASDHGIGAVLTQNFEDGERVICYLSRSLTRSERNFSTTEKECLAVVWAVEKLRHYLELTSFKVITDHHSLIWLNNLKDPQGRLARWSLRLMPYNFEIFHRKGKFNVVPDMLSRSVPSAVNAIELSSDSISSDFHSTKDRWYLKMKSRLIENPDTYPQWRIEKDVILKYVSCAYPDMQDESTCWKIVVPKEFRGDLIRSIHEDIKSGHPGIFKTYWRLRARYYWPKMKADVARIVRRCITCLEYKPDYKAQGGYMGTRPVVSEPWEMISMDFVGPLPSSNGFKYIFVVTDYFSKFILPFPLRSANARNMCKILEEQIFLVYGVPRFVISDNGPQMRHRIYRDLCDKYKIRKILTPYYSPHCDPTERSNGIIKTVLSCYVKDNHKSWSNHIAAVGCAIRTARQETIGCSPFYVNFGREYRGSADAYDHPLPSKYLSPKDYAEGKQTGYKALFEDIKKRLDEAQERNRRRYNLRRRPVEYRVGDTVMLKNHVLSDATKGFTAKLAKKFVGPFKISKRIGYCVYQLADTDGKERGNWHTKDLKPCLGDEADV